MTGGDAKRPKARATDKELPRAKSATPSIPKASSAVAHKRRLEDIYESQGATPKRVRPMLPTGRESTELAPTKQYTMDVDELYSLRDRLSLRDLPSYNQFLHRNQAPVEPDFYAEIDYSLDDQADPMSPPHETDSIATLDEKLSGITLALWENKSMACLMGDRKDIERLQEPEKAARATMTPLELNLYNEWKSGNEPSRDFNGEIEPVGTKEADIRLYDDFAASLEKLYKVEGLTGAHARAFCEKNQELIPLLVAIGKEAKVIRNHAGGRDGRDPRKELEESVIRVARVHIEHQRCRLARVIESLTTVDGYLNTRLRKLHNGRV